MAEERNNRDFRAIESILNHMGFDEAEMAKRLANTHPTLQQTFMRLAAEFIYAEAQKEYFDGRNEATGKACKKLSKMMKDEEIYFPHV